jgi:heme A synthase
VLGRIAGPSRAAFVGVGNLLAGLAMFALSLRLVQASGPARPAPARLRAWTLVALVLLLVQIALGGWVSVTQLSDRCGHAALCLWHRGTALGVLAMLLPLGIMAMRKGARGRGGALVSLVVAQAALGLAMLWVPAVPLALGLAHNVLAGLLLAVLLALLPARAS